MLTEDPELYAEMLNNVFLHGQFQTDYMACDSPKIEVSREESLEITIEGVAKLISELLNGKSSDLMGFINLTCSLT